MPNSNYDIRKIYEEMELDLIRSMKRNLKRHQEEELKVGFKFEQWQKAKLRELRKFKSEIKKKVLDKDKEIRRSIKDTLINTYRQAETKAKTFTSKVLKINIKMPVDLNLIEQKVWDKVLAPKEETFFRINDKKFKALTDAVNNDIKKANTAILRRMDDVYRQTIYKTQVFYNTGNVGLEKAVDMATKDFLAKGIDSITYSDGKKVNIASYAEMALRTANHRAYLMGEGNSRKEMGLFLVLVSTHMTACELCVPWQGLVLIDDVYSGGKKGDAPYQLLSRAVDEGLLHVNCRHNLGTYFPGVTTIPDKPNPDEVLARYKQEQKQRRIEREIREQKRKVAGTINEENLVKEKDRLKNLQSKMRGHLKKNPQLRRAYGKESRGGYQ